MEVGQTPDLYAHAQHRAASSLGGTFQFMGACGRINESDVLITVPGGLNLLELKGHSRQILNHSGTCHSHGGRVSTLRNPCI